MKSSSGEHYIALDHLRALAIFMVFTWHFTHSTNGYPIPFEGAPLIFPFSLLDEGHTGVALFMTLSGYLFAKLLNGKQINYLAFFWNRFIRLAPLLLVVIVLTGTIIWVNGQDLQRYRMDVVKGLWQPTLPNGGWSLTVEGHFYVLLPILLWLFRKSPRYLLLFLLAAILLRVFFYQQRGEMQSLGYWRIVGRIDQFLLGILAFHYRSLFTKRHLLAIGGILAFTLFYYFFDRAGGFYKFPTYPSPSPLWIIIPTIEGLAYALLISYYDNSFSFPTNGLSGFIGRIGAYSYSIYLLHGYLVFSSALFVHENILDLSNFYLACLFSAICFLPMIPIGYLSFRFIEAPFLKFRVRYVIDPNQQQPKPTTLLAGLFNGKKESVTNKSAKVETGR